MADRGMRGPFTSFLREPIFHFVLVGSLLFGLVQLNTPPDPQAIRIDDRVISQIAARYQRQFGEAPPADRFRALIGRHIYEEALYRHGLALGLDRGDEIVRRRIVQKMEFLAGDEGDVGEPTPAQLRAWYQTHQDRYRQPEQISFRQIYFSPDKNGEAAALTRARNALQKVKAGVAVDAIQSDQFSEGEHFILVEPGQIERIFGSSALTQQVSSLPLNQWSGPLRSGLGWHLVRLEAKIADKPPALESISGRLRQDWREDRMAANQHDAIGRILKDFVVVRAGVAKSL